MATAFARRTPNSRLRSADWGLHAAGGTAPWCAVHLIRILLRITTIVMVAVAAYLVVWQPKATVASVNLTTPINVSVQCSSLWNQWTHHAQPASLNLNNTRLVPLQ
ncbi:MAG TPA: hypothetical protein VNG12_17975, partial [Acidimicrobiales bacterium]|nr:hypothetical protein [Acidimicrobiales bacterium]